MCSTCLRPTCLYLSTLPVTLEAHTFWLLATWGHSGTSLSNSFPHVFQWISSMPNEDLLCHKANHNTDPLMHLWFQPFLDTAELTEIILLSGKVEILLRYSRALRLFCYQLSVTGPWSSLPHSSSQYDAGLTLWSDQALACSWTWGVRPRRAGQWSTGCLKSWG